MICDSACWAATGSMMQGWAALGGVAAVIYAANRASNTFALYRRQKQEDRRIESAERLLTLAYKIRRDLQGVRSPASTGNEIQEARLQLEQGEWFRGLDEARQRKAEIGQIILRRLQTHQEDWDQIFENMPIARALFGEAVEGLLQRLWKNVVAVQVSADMYRMDQGHDLDFTKRLERDFWGHGDDDAISRDVLKTIGVFEAIMLPVIRADYKAPAPIVPDPLART